MAIYMREDSSSLVITEIQFKTTVKYYILLRMAKILKSNNIKCH